MEKGIMYNGEMTQTTCEELIFGLNRVKITIAEIHEDECFGDECSENNDCNNYMKEIEEAIEVVKKPEGVFNTPKIPGIFARVKRQDGIRVI